MKLQQLLVSAGRNDVLTAARRLYPDADQNVLARVFDDLCGIKPEYGYFDLIINVAPKDGVVRVSNTHIGSLADLAGRRVTLDDALAGKPAEAAAHCVYQIATHQYDTERFKDHLDEW